MACLKELKEQRCEIAGKMHQIHEKAEAENRGLTSEENESWDNLMSQIKEQDQRIKTAEELETVGSSFVDMEEEKRLFDEKKRSFQEDRTKPLDRVDTNRAIRCWMAGSVDYEGKDRESELMQRAGFHGRSIEIGRSADEKRATQLKGTANVGGDTVPDDMMAPLERALLHFGGMMEVSRMLRTDTGRTMPIPTSNDTTNTGEVIAEDNAVNEQTMPFAQSTLSAYKYSSKMIPISIELLQDSATNFVQLIGEVVGERIGRIVNTHATTGDGSSKITGVVTGAADSSITTATATTVSFDNLVDLKHSVDIAYRRQGARFMFNDTTAGIIEKIKDDQNQPLFLPSLREGVPDTILGFPFTVNNDMANGSSAKSILFGAFNNYWIREVRGVTLLRLDERYAEFHRVAFLAFARYDGKLINAGTNPIKYLTQAV